MVRKRMGGRSLRALGGVGLTNHQKALSQVPFRPLMWHYVSTTRNPHVPLPSSHQGGTGVGENLVKGELGTWPHWAPLQGTGPPTSSPGGEWPTQSKPGKWHKWAMQPFIKMWHYLQWLFTDIYICNLITYSCTKSIKMLWGLFLHLTNLLISFHQQSSVLLHQGTTFKEANV